VGQQAQLLAFSIDGGDLGTCLFVLAGRDLKTRKDNARYPPNCPRNNALGLHDLPYTRWVIIGSVRFRPWTSAPVVHQKGFLRILPTSFVKSSLLHLPPQTNKTPGTLPLREAIFFSETRSHCNWTRNPFHHAEEFLKGPRCPADTTPRIHPLTSCRP